MKYFLMFVLCALAAMVTGKTVLQQNHKSENAPEITPAIPTAPPYTSAAGAPVSAIPVAIPTHEPMIALAPPLRGAYNTLLGKKIREWRENRLLELAAGEQSVPNIDIEMYLMNIEIPFDELCRLQDSAREEVLKQSSVSSPSPVAK